MTQKLIVLMIDGVSADHYATLKSELPHLASLERRGFRVHNLHSEVLGTSLPGRTSMMTGETADVSGVYGNRIWDGQAFRYPNPDDVRVPTLPARAKAAGKKVAVVGFGMLRPEDAHIFRGPWWVGGFIQRARDAEPTPADQSWLRVAFHDPGKEFDRACEAAGVASHLPETDLTTEAGRASFAIMSDVRMYDWVGALATWQDAPDLIIAEFLCTDTIQHYSGYKSEAARFSVMQADMAVGRILARLEAANALDQWNIAVMSDHGHSPIETALHPGHIIPNVTVQSEGSLLIVAPQDEAELAMVTEKLAAYNVEPYPNDCIVPEYRDRLFLFVAPDKVSFEVENVDNSTPSGKPNAISSHGLRPGHPGDDRFALFAGPDVPRGSVEAADAIQVAPTLAKLAGLSDTFRGQSIF
ncbi:alkaline phosphatase family protein [Aggregatilineales bacterium SYSU G02658]